MIRDTNWNSLSLCCLLINYIRSVISVLFLGDVLGMYLYVAAYPTSETSLLYPGVGQVAGTSGSRGMCLRTSPQY
jgi:hypothetical protein